MTPLSKSDQDLYSFIRQNILTSGKQPVYRKMIKVIKKASLRSVTLALERLVHANLITMDKSKIALTTTYLKYGITNTIDIPLVPNYTKTISLYHEAKVITTIPISTDLLDPEGTFFLIKIQNDDINMAFIKGTPCTSGNLALVKIQEPTTADKIVVAIINGSAVIRGHYKTEDKIFLYPMSTDLSLTPIILSNTNHIEYIVWDVLPSHLFTNLESLEKPQHEHS